jgi:hypothetical protein
MSILRIDIREWQQLQPEKGSPLFHRYIEDEAARYTIKELNEKGIVNILELKDELRITSNSYVGKIKIGDTELNIHPKIEGMPLYKLLKYGFCGNEGQQGSLPAGRQIQRPLGEKSAQGNALSTVDLCCKRIWQQHRKNTLPIHAPGGKTAEIRH